TRRASARGALASPYHTPAPEPAPGTGVASCDTPPPASASPAPDADAPRCTRAGTGPRPAAEPDDWPGASLSSLGAYGACVRAARSVQDVQAESSAAQCPA